MESSTLLAIFVGAILFMLFLDLTVFHRQVHEIKVKEAALWVTFWIALAMAFNVGVYYWFGTTKALEFLTGYLIEESLSVDNVFVFLVVLSFFSVRPSYQHRVLFWGILGAMIMRALFIWGGAYLLESFHFVQYIFGAFLVYTAWKLFRQGDIKVEPEKNPILRLAKRFFPVASDYDGPAFWVKKSGKIFATPLFLVLLVIEATDVVFATDSIPAIFSITRDPFIVYTSNIFAILGLRSLYFLLAGIMKELKYLGTGLSFILGFVGIKMLIADYYHIPIVWSLAVVASILGLAVVASLVKLQSKELKSTK